MAWFYFPYVFVSKCHHNVFTSFWNIIPRLKFTWSNFISERDLIILWRILFIWLDGMFLLYQERKPVEVYCRACAQVTRTWPVWGNSKLNIKNVNLTKRTYYCHLMPSKIVNCDGYICNISERRSGLRALRFRQLFRQRLDVNTVCTFRFTTLLQWCGGRSANYGLSPLKSPSSFQPFSYQRSIRLVRLLFADPVLFIIFSLTILNMFDIPAPKPSRFFLCFAKKRKFCFCKKSFL